jgi:hypothetical protein
MEWVVDPEPELVSPEFCFTNYCINCGSLCGLNGCLLDGCFIKF